ncbi:hypothetical protein ACCO45_009925 [Purpureocillium lilacinum]|uniref:Uncharacterized protein n=1 Tax=Purpureocillium lilacinum TaxID=33203 RepID=A0ACC4DEX4_PURLI
MEEHLANASTGMTRLTTPRGQPLPNPKTMLPPRRAAHCSRERRRLELESLQTYNKKLQLRLIEVNDANDMMTLVLSHMLADQGYPADAQQIPLRYHTLQMATLPEVAPTQAAVEGESAIGINRSNQDVSELAVKPIHAYSERSESDREANLMERIFEATQSSDEQLAGDPMTELYASDRPRLDHTTPLLRIGPDDGEAALGARGTDRVSQPRAEAHASLIADFVIDDELTLESSNVAAGILMSRCDRAVDSPERENDTGVGAS